jgi:hypothetical protein
MFDKQQANTIFWSPQGQFVVLAGLRRCVLGLCFLWALMLGGCFPLHGHPNRITHRCFTGGSACVLCG